MALGGVRPDSVWVAEYQKARVGGEYQKARVGGEIGNCCGIPVLL